MSFPPATEMFQFAGFASPTYGFSRRWPKRAGLPHSEIRGSKGARPSPRLFAACHVLHRLSVPRHPPNALTRLIQGPAAAHREKTPCPRAAKPRLTLSTHVTRLAALPDPDPQGSPPQGPAIQNRQPVAFLSTMSKSRSQGSGIRDQRKPHAHGPSQLVSSLGSPRWWSRPGSNRRPPACKAGALPAELRPRFRRQRTEIRRQTGRRRRRSASSALRPLSSVL